MKSETLDAAIERLTVEIERGNKSHILGLLKAQGILLAMQLEVLREEKKPPEEGARLERQFNEWNERIFTLHNF